MSKDIHARADGNMKVIENLFYDELDNILLVMQKMMTESGDFTTAAEIGGGMVGKKAYEIVKTEYKQLYLSVFIGKILANEYTLTNKILEQDKKFFIENAALVFGYFGDDYVRKFQDVMSPDNKKPPSEQSLTNLWISIFHLLAYSVSYVSLAIFLHEKNKLHILNEKEVAVGKDGVLRYSCFIDEYRQGEVKKHIDSVDKWDIHSVFADTLAILRGKGELAEGIVCDMEVYGKIFGFDPEAQ